MIHAQPDTAFRRLGDDESVVLHLKSAEYFKLNRMGTTIWEQLDSPISFAGLVDRLKAELVDAPESLESDLRGFLAALVARDLVSIHTAHE
jgi:hypothetical protein